MKLNKFNNSHSHSRSRSTSGIAASMNGTGRGGGGGFAGGSTFFDTSLIPSLPSVGDIVDHAQLMGLGRVQTSKLLPMPPQATIGPQGSRPRPSFQGQAQIQPKARSQSQHEIFTYPSADPRYSSVSGVQAGREQKQGYGNAAGIGQGSGVQVGSVMGVGRGNGRSGDFLPQQGYTRSPPSFDGAKLAPGAGYGHSRNVSVGSMDTVGDRARDDYYHPDRGKSNSEQVHPHSLDHSNFGGDPYSHDTQAVRPGMIRRTSSYGHPPPRANQSQHEEGRGIKHSRTWSGPSGDMSPHGYTHAHTQSNQHGQSYPHIHNPSRSDHPNHDESYVFEHSRRGNSARSSSLPPSAGYGHSDAHKFDQDDNGIFLGDLNTYNAEDTETLIELLAQLDYLTPFDRVPDPAPPPPTSCILHPFSLLTPMAIILEALVCERSVLKGVPLKNPLPILRSGKEFQLVHKVLSDSVREANADLDQIASAGSEKRDELDWGVVKSYVLSLGNILDALLPYIRDHSSSNTSRPTSFDSSVTGVSNESQDEKEDQEKISDLTNSVRAYVGKMKKVFGEVAAMYVDHYGFMRGWWDDEEMKSAAGEVGRWGDLFDA